MWGADFLGPWAVVGGGAPAPLLHPAPGGRGGNCCCCFGSSRSRRPSLLQPEREARGQADLQLGVNPRPDTAWPAPCASACSAVCSMASCLPRIHSELACSLWDSLGLDPKPAWLASRRRSSRFNKVTLSLPLPFFLPPLLPSLFQNSLLLDQFLFDLG